MVGEGTAGIARGSTDLAGAADSHVRDAAQAAHLAGGRLIGCAPEHRIEHTLRQALHTLHACVKGTHVHGRDMSKTSNKQPDVLLFWPFPLQCASRVG